jgi:PKD repeat protein
VSRTLPPNRPVTRRAALISLAAIIVVGLTPGRAAASSTPVGFTPAVPATGRRVAFTASPTLDPGQTVIGYDRRFGARKTTRRISANVPHRFGRPGPRPITATISAQTPQPPPATPTRATATATADGSDNTPPAASFSFTPVNPQPGTAVTFTSTSTDIDGTITAWSWDLDGDGRFGDATTPSTTFTFLTGGLHLVSLRVTDDRGAVATARQNVLVDRPPVASFTWTPSNPLVGQAIRFSSTSTDPDGNNTIVKQEWDLTGNGQFTDAIGSTATKVFAQAGDAIVRLRVTDDRGVSSIAAMTVPVGGAPVAGFDISTNPTTGRPVTFTSTSRDRAGAIVRSEWDLDGDGLFDDAVGSTVTHTYAAAGAYTVGLRVTNTSGVTDIAFHSIVVRDPSPPTAPRQPAVAGSRSTPLLLPFPIVRIAGRVGGASTRISLLEVRAPIGSRILVRCKGPGCPRRDIVKVVTNHKPVRFKKMVRRLRPGAVVEVFVRAGGRVGKYTRFTVRRGKPPLRRDMCLPPTTSRPEPCTA